MWLEHSLEPKVQGDVAAWFGSVPAVPAACKGNELLTDDGCETNGFDNFDKISVLEDADRQMRHPGGLRALFALGERLHRHRRRADERGDASREHGTTAPGRLRLVQRGADSIPSPSPFRGVDRHFGPVRAVDGVDLDIAPGEFFAMLGPSGSGKTTCLRLIAGFEQPTAGRIEIFGEAVEGVPAYRRPVNTVFQDYALFPHMNVLENVCYGLMIRRRGAGRAREARPRGARARQARRHGGAQAGPALRRPAPARRARPRAGRPAEGAPPRRAARRARPQAPRGDAGRAEDPAAHARPHLRLRHPRPGRGAVDGRPRRRLQRTAASSRSARPRRSTSGRAPASSPISSAAPTSSSRRRSQSVDRARRGRRACARRRSRCSATAPRARRAPSASTARSAQVLYQGAIKRIEIADRDRSAGRAPCRPRQAAPLAEGEAVRAVFAREALHLMDEA